MGGSLASRAALVGPRQRYPRGPVPAGHRRRAGLGGTGKEKASPLYDLPSLAQAHGGEWAVLTGCRKGPVRTALAAGGPAAAAAELRMLARMFGHENVFVELTCGNDPCDDERNDALYTLAGSLGLGVVASANVHYATPAHARLASALAAIRARSSLDEMDGWLPGAGTAYLRSGAEMATLLRGYPGVFDRTVSLALECAFDFRVVAPNLPDFPVPAGHTEASWLRPWWPRRRGTGAPTRRPSLARSRRRRANST